ncbi:MAG TPA: right-handed parallel beta-helix repeat-containing protein, partial [Polyangiales bacterium]
MSQADGSAMVSIATAALPGTPILTVPGTSWGFSPDGDRFEIVHIAGGLPYATLYNLAAPHPATWIYQTPDLAVGGYLAFSPNGRYAIAMWLAPNMDDFHLDVRDAVTGAQVHHNNFIFATAPGATLPAGQGELAGVVIGFGPDTEDRSLVYAYAASNGQYNWALVNLQSSSAAIGWQTPSNYGFTWGFSPCGDALALVISNGHTDLKEARLYSTLDFAQLGYTEYPVADPDFFNTDASSHVVTHYLTPVTLAPNLASATCAGSVTVPPTAAFSGPATTLALLPVTFTDQSTSSPGTITAYQWSFADGAGSASYLPSPTYTFLSPGTHTVQLTVTNSQGRADTVSHDVVVGANQPPVASFSYTPMPPMTRDIVTFTSTSTDDDGTPTAYWSIDGASPTGTVVQAKACAPQMSVQLTVRDNAGQETMIMQDIAVAPSPELLVPAGGNLVAAAAAACPGDTLVLEAGHYAGGVFLDGVNLRGQGAGKTWIDGYGDATVSNGWVLTLHSPWAGFNVTPLTETVTDVTVQGGGSSAAVGGGVLIQADSWALLSHVEVTSNGGAAGVYSYNNNGQVDITDGRVHDNSARGIYLDNQAKVNVLRTEIAANAGGGAAITESSDVTFADNDVHDNSGSLREAGVYFDITHGSQVFGNRFYGNASTDPEGVAVYLSGGLRVEFTGNLIVANQTGGLYDEDGAVLSGCTIANNCGAGLSMRNNVNTKLYNSILYGNTVDLGGTLADDVANLVGKDPLFAGAGDYHLASNSPAIDQGDNTYVPTDVTLDGDGDARLLAKSSGGAATVDIGWDEWRTGQASAPLSATGCGPSSLDGGVDAGPVAADGGGSGGGAGTAGHAGSGGAGSGSSAPGTAVDAGVGALADASAAAAGDGGLRDGAADSDAAAGTPAHNAGCGCSLTPVERTPATPFAFAGLLALFITRRRAARRARRGVAGHID